MFPILAEKSNWYSRPDIVLLLIILVALTIITQLLFKYQRKSLWALSILFFVINTLYLFSSHDLYASTDYKSDYSNFIAEGEMKKKPDIYLLTYDSYVSNETMKQYGIDNTAQETFLLDNDFKMYPGTYSLGRSSLISMSRVLEISDDITSPERFSTSGVALVPSILQKNGYHTYGVLDSYYLQNDKIGYQTVFPDKHESTDATHAVYTGIKEGQFRFDLFYETEKYSHEEWIEQKRNVFTLNSNEPKFMYTHTGPHHAQTSGKCLPDETERFEQRLLKSNIEMKEDIESILSSKRDAIIIINGDHGPRLSGDCKDLEGYQSSEITQLHLQDRYGSFLAIRWPDNHYKQYDDIRILQDTFESVFKYLFQSDDVLKERVSTEFVHTPFSEATNAISHGIIEIGVDKGKPLFNIVQAEPTTD